MDMLQLGHELLVGSLTFNIKGWLGQFKSGCIQ